MTREKVAEWLEFLQEAEHNKADSIVPCTNEIALGIAIEALKQPQIVRCKDCIYGDVPNLVYRKDDIYCARYEIFHNRDFYCADAERKEGDEDG